MARKVQLQTNGKEWQVIDGEQVLVDVEKQDIDPITSSSCVQIEGFRTLEEAVSDNKMLSQDLTYTKVMDKVGGDYHQNVLDGQYSKAILYGNTQVNLCEEDSSVALQIPTTFTSFNNGELQIKNKESQVVAPLIKGVTMVNLAQINSMLVESGRAVPIQNVKGNTVYTLSFTFTTKNTNSGVVIECYDVNGEYLGNVMHKTGLGDVVKFTFTTHANATKIHICNNAAYGGETIQLDEIMLIEGDQTALDIPFFKGMRSVELSRPLTNLFNNDLQHYDANVTSTNNNGTVTVTATSNNSWANVHYNLTNLKANTNYLVMWDSITVTQTSTTSTDILICVAQASNNSNLGRMDNNDLNPTKRCIMFNTANIPLTDIVLRIHATLGNTETGTTTVTGLRVFEYDDYLRSVDLQSIGWFSGTKNVAVEPIKTCSKNLYPYGDINFTPTKVAWYDAKGNSEMFGDIASKSKSRFLLRKGTYTLSSGSKTNLGYQLVSDKEDVISLGTTETFTLTQDTYYTLRFKSTEANVASSVTNIQIERGETVTDYVAHDSRYYEPDGQNAIVLRSLPSGVCDTFNLQTGEYTRRINEVVFDGSSDENWYAVTYSPWTENGYYTFEYFIQSGAIPTYDDNNGIYAICDKFNGIAYNTARTDAVGILLYDGQGKKVAIKQKEFTTLDEWKQYLQSNPLTVQYQLANPITTIIPRTIKRNNNGTVSTVDFGTYTNKENLVIPKNPSYLTINSMTSIKPVVEPITYIDFKTRLKANTDYSLIMDKDSANKTINLGGTSKTYANKMLVRTPSIDLEQNLRISGNGSIQNIMVIEGDVLDKELPYFNGMCNVKMPIVRNMGRNLLDNNNVMVTYDTNIILRAYPTFPCKPGKRYVYCVDKFGAESSCNWYSCKRDAVLVNGSEATGIIEYLGYSTSIVAPPDCKYLCIYSGGSTNLDPYSIHTYVYEVDTLAEAQAIGYTDYKENQICLTQGEIGLSQDMFETGGYGTGSGATKYEDMKYDVVDRTRMKTYLKVKPNTTYRLTYDGKTNFNHREYMMDGVTNGRYSTFDTKEKVFTTKDTTEYITILIACTYSSFKPEYLQLLELDSTVQLRSLPNGVKDELNLLTGEYIQRVGEIVLDGSENWGASDVISKRYSLDLYATMNAVIDKTKILCICDKIQSITTNQSDNDKMLGITITNGNRVMINTNYDTINEFKNWLSQNPITVQYELAEPIISYPRIVSNTQEREVGVKLPYGGICDTYNPSTGITVKRVGKVVLDGSEDWVLDTTKTNTQVFKMPAPKDFAPTYNNFITESLPTNDGTGSDTEKIAANQSNHSATSGLIWCMYIALLKTKASTVDEFKTYLASNPITVYYELANPIVTTDIVLPNGVHDEYNPLTGLYTKRVGYIELDGSDDEEWSPQLGTGNDTHCYASISIDGTISPQMKHMATHDEVYIMSNSYETVARSNYSYDKEQMYVWSVRTVYLNILQSRLSTVDITGFRQFLSQNPIKLWYELQNPITYQLTPYFGLPMPYAYKDGYLIMDSAYDGQTLPPEITYQLTVNRTGQITQNNIKLKEHTARLSNLEYILIEATLDSIFDREMQNFELELMNIKLLDLDE